MDKLGIKSKDGVFLNGFLDVEKVLKILGGAIDDISKLLYIERGSFPFL